MQTRTKPFLVLKFRGSICGPHHLLWICFCTGDDVLLLFPIAPQENTYCLFAAVCYIHLECLKHCRKNSTWNSSKFLRSIAKLAFSEEGEIHSEFSLFLVLFFDRMAFDKGVGVIPTISEQPKHFLPAPFFPKLSNLWAHLKLPLCSGLHRPSDATVYRPLTQRRGPSWGWHLLWCRLRQGHRTRWQSLWNLAFLKVFLQTLGNNWTRNLLGLRKATFSFWGWQDAGFPTLQRGWRRNGHRFLIISW